MKVMKKYRVLLSSAPDGASVSIAGYLVENYNFIESDIFPGASVFENFLLLKSDIRHLYYDNLENDLNSHGVDPVDIVFLSKHSSAAGIKSLTVHATGNFGKAELGGLDDHVSMSDPKFMTSSLRILASKPTDSFSITFEATHHGPLINVPSYFIEIGTTESEWKDHEALSIVSKAIVDSAENGSPSYVGVGGGHYSPKITQYVLDNDINIGHIISKHSHNNLTPEMLVQTLENTPECKGFLMDNKGTRGHIRQMVKDTVNKRGLELILL